VYLAARCWIELGAFTSVFRTHEGNISEVNHQIYSDRETLTHFARFAKTYTAWKPYRMELVKEASETGLPVLRHPFIHYPNDPEVPAWSTSSWSAPSSCSRPCSTLAKTA
jgi:alpha-glucosidase (family GH31 glycosyl hydrolase)